MDVLPKFDVDLNGRPKGLYAASLIFIALDAAMTASIDNLWTDVQTPRVLFALQGLFHWILLLIGISATDEKRVAKFFRFAVVWLLRTALLLGCRIPRITDYTTSAVFYDHNLLRIVQGVFQVFSVFYYVALIRAINSTPN